MGRKGTGVEIRGKAFHIQFSLNGKIVRRTLKRDGAALLRQRALTQLAGDFAFLDPRYGKPWTGERDSSPDLSQNWRRWQAVQR